MIPSSFPTLGNEVAPTTPAQSAANNAASAQNGEQFAKVLDKASSRNEPKSSSKDSKAAKAVKNDESRAKSTDDSKSVDEAETKPAEGKATKSADESRSETSPENNGEHKQPATEPIAPVAVKAVDVAALSLLPALATAAPVAVAVAPVLDPAAPAVVAPVLTPVTEQTVATPVAVALAVTTAVPGSATAVEAGTASTATATTTADLDVTLAAPAATLPTATVATETESPSLVVPTTVVAAEVPKEATAKAATPAVDPALAALNAVSKTNATTATTAVTATNAPAPDVHAEPYKQVLQIVQPLRGRDGDHNITISLAPENLGRVEVQINLQSNNISMQMNADNPQSRQMLKDSMNELRQSLTDSGLNAGSLDVSSQDAGHQSQQSANSGSNRSRDSGDVEISEDEFFARLATTAGSAPIGDGPLDIRA